jgi:4-hydroxythreonine-4-phosphate dehydrogenase
LVKRSPGFFLVTAPVNKQAIAESGARGASKFRGHTEWLQARDAATSSVMCFWSETLSTTLVTTHLPLSKVPQAISAGAVRQSTLALAQLLRRLGKRCPTIAVASLNPHAGEGELLGREERTEIAPGIASAQAELGRRAKIIGPIGAETAYRKAHAGLYDGVVAMYHDQATIPLKLLAFGAAVNVTLGLSIVRTSVDHGTAYDIAWKGRADHRGMLAALELGARLAR